MADAVKHELLYNVYGVAFLTLLCILGYQFGTLALFLLSGMSETAGFGLSFGTSLAHLALAWNCAIKLHGPLDNDKSYAHMLATVLFALGAVFYAALYSWSRPSVLYLPLAVYLAVLIAFWAWDFAVIVNFKDYPLLFPFYSPADVKRMPRRLAGARPNLALLSHFSAAGLSRMAAGRKVAPRFVVAAPDSSDGKEPMPLDDSDIAEAIKISEETASI